LTPLQEEFPNSKFNKIALIGSAPSSIRLAPYSDETFSIWGCSPGVYGVAPRSEMWFELHRYEPGKPWFSPEYCQFLAKHACVWMADPQSSFKRARRFPLEPMVEKYGPYFFASTLSYMFAMAIEMKPEVIGLWGVDMAAQEEWIYQRPGVQYFYQIAKQQGIDVIVPPESDLLVPPPFYGFCEMEHKHIKLLARKNELEARKQHAQLQVDAAMKELMFLSGAVDDLDYVQKTWVGQNEPGVPTHQILP
jgi:hypothetical protein